MSRPSDSLVPLVLVTGLDRDLTAAVADAVLGGYGPGTALVHHDVSSLGQGVVLRTVRIIESGGHAREDSRAVELAHGCVSCTLRLDVLPLLSELASRAEIGRIVLHLDPALEPEPLAWSISHVVLEVPGDTVSLGSEPVVADHVGIEATVAVVDAARWLEDASGDATMADRGMAATVDDERTVAQVCVGQVEFADLVIVAGRPADAMAAARFDAVIDRLAPSALRRGPYLDGLTAAIDGLGPQARRGRIDGPHDPLLVGEPPLAPDDGVQLVCFSARRPFHPVRLHHALDVLLDGVVRTRGRIWLATQPDRVLWLESAGGGLWVSGAGPWLAAFTSPEREEVSDERQVAAALRWDPEHGDRDIEIAALSLDQSAENILRALEEALLTDAELAAGREVWADWEDPFGDWHEDPCESEDETEDSTSATRKDIR